MISLRRRAVLIQYRLSFQVLWFFEQPMSPRFEGLYGLVREKPGALNQWTVKISGGPEVARKVAHKHGFGYYIGDVS